ncbi:MAG: hypothetical protein V1818_00920 [Candidatus Aenigmatarchaeota archaeon]
MKMLIMAAIFLLSVTPVLAVNITVGNLTIMIPKIAINATNMPNITLNQTVRIDVLKLMQDFGVSDMLNQQLVIFYDVFKDVLKLSIAKSLEMLPDLVSVMTNTYSEKC